MTEPLPAFPDYCWPVDWACCTAPGASACSHDDDVKDRAEALATQTLRALTAYRVGGCPITVRPCRAGCTSVAWAFDLNGAFSPGITIDGVWVNNACRRCARHDCDCSTTCEVLLPGPVGRVDAVWLNGTQLPPPWYRVDNGNALVWVGDPTRPEMTCPWPLCQEMAKPISEIGTFAVTYLQGIPVDGLGAYAAGVLACEFAKACAGDTCRLPYGVSAIARQGVSMTFTPTSFPGGMTGIPDVDAYIRYWNPNALKQRSRVWSPDVRKARKTTWAPS